MTTFSIQTIDAEIIPESRKVDVAPGQGFDKEEGHYSHRVRFSHLSGWLADFAVVNFPQANKTMGLFIWTGGQTAPPLDRLDRAGNIEVLPRGDHWVCALRVMRQPPGKPRASLHQVSLPELDQLVGGDFSSFVNQFGHTEIARYGDLNPDAGRNVVNGLGLRTTSGNVAVIAAAVAVTRPVALLKGLN